MTRLFDHPSAFGVIAVGGAVLMLMSCHNGVVTSRDGVRPDSTRARLCTTVTAIGA
jgi:hypothetical protein